MRCFLLTKDFPNWLLLCLLQASIVTVIHLVNAVVDTVNKEGMSVCFVSVVCSDCKWGAVRLPIVLLLKQFILRGGLAAFILGRPFLFTV